MQNAAGARVDLFRAPSKVVPEGTKLAAFGLVSTLEKRRLPLLTVTNVGRTA